MMLRTSFLSATSFSAIFCGTFAGEFSGVCCCSGCFLEHLPEIYLAFVAEFAYLGNICRSFNWVFVAALACLLMHVNKCLCPHAQIDWNA